MCVWGLCYCNGVETLTDYRSLTGARVSAEQLLLGLFSRRHCLVCYAWCARLHLVTLSFSSHSDLVGFELFEI